MTRILIVEDEVDLAELLRDLFELRGYRVSLAFDGREGLAKAVSERPDVVLTDVMMPHLDGVEMIARLRRNPDTRHIPVVAMSALDDVTFDPVVRKPFEFDAVLALIEKMLADSTG